tara:strand:+ start:179 stop:388 length:210 start_codon:yes stop_codon:yes gene_type:complete
MKGSKMYHITIERNDEVVEDWHGKIFSDEIGKADSMTKSGDTLTVVWSLECLDGYEDTDEVLYQRHIDK